MNKFMCTLCLGERFSNEFYYNRKTGKRHTYCKGCLNNETVKRQRRIKEEAVKYKGGKCEKCGYNKYIGALQFHHRDSAQKDLNWNHFKLRKFNDAFMQELDKCILVCANCHAEIHGEK